MRSLFYHLAEFVQKQPFYALLSYLCFWLCFLLLGQHFFASKLNYFIPAVMVMIVSLLLAEPLLRVLLRCCYGPAYRYSYTTYFLVDDQQYGYSFRKNARAQQITFPIFDQFLYKPGEARLLVKGINSKPRYDFNINSLGFRGAEFLPRSKKNKIRIFCTGGSTTAGDRNNDADCWPEQLQYFLRQRDYDVEVINAGVEGWYSYQEWLRFSAEIIHYKPDMVLIHQGWNEEFEYSSLSLGKEWQEKLIRNVAEANNFYCRPSPFLAKNKSVLLHLLLQEYRLKYCFKPNMSFSNESRWQCLQSSDYISAWLRNLLAFAQLAKERNITLYTVDYPCLVSMQDSSLDRKCYLENSRLTEYFAQYQAIAKKRISNTLRHFSAVVPCLNGEAAFRSITGRERCRLFHDEIHMTAAGNRVLAEALASQLSADKHFNDCFSSDKAMTNVNWQPEVISNLQLKAKNNSSNIAREINSIIIELRRKKRQTTYSEENVPTTRYTTF